MCGFAGVLHFDRDWKVDEGRLTVARESLIHRGPEYGANFIDGNLGLAHRRLSIIDLSADGNQPMVSSNGRYVIIYNGEIYNYQQLQKQLAAKGILFKSNSDTEVLLCMYIVYGEAMLEQLNGMFSFAIWDKQERSLFIARDRVGIKPLYYYQDGESFVFASEAKALFRYGLPLEIEEDNLNEFLLFRFVSGEKTLFKNIKKLMPGHSMLVTEDKNIHIKCWWHLADKIKNHGTIHKPVEWFTNTFDDAIQKHMISDVPIGVLLSGGLDSSSVCASLYKQGFQHIQTFNVGFKNFVDDESKLAENLSRKFDFPYHSIHVEDDELAENLSIADYMLDEPLIHQNEPQIIAISRYAKKTVTVLLSGEGADEFLGGYVRYKPLKYLPYKGIINLLLSSLPQGYKNNRLSKLQRYFTLDSVDDMILFNSVNNFPSDLKKMGIEMQDIHVDYRNRILHEAKELYPNNPQRQAMYLDQHTYLQSLNHRNDRTTMAASIECRVPFLDHRLMEGLGTLSNDYFFQGKKGKFILKESYKNILPQTTLNFRKIGFSVPWLQFILKSKKLKHHWDTMEQCELFNMGWLKFIDVAKLRNETNKGDSSIQALLLQLFFISLWWKQYTNHFDKSIK